MLGHWAEKGGSQTMGQSLYNHEYPIDKQIRSSTRANSDADVNNVNIDPKSGPIACRSLYNDGLRATMLMMNGLVEDFNVAATLRGREEILSTMVSLDHAPNTSYSGILTSNAEQLFETGVSPMPLERTLLTAGLVATASAALHRGHEGRGPPAATPHLNMAYSVGLERLWGGRDEPY